MIIFAKSSIKDVWLWILLFQANCFRNRRQYWCCQITFLGFPGNTLIQKTRASGITNIIPMFIFPWKRNKQTSRSFDTNLLWILKDKWNIYIASLGYLSFTEFTHLLSFTSISKILKSILRALLKPWKGNNEDIRAIAVDINLISFLLTLESRGF